MAIFSDLAQVMQNARTDAKTLDNYIHGAADTKVTSRLGKQYWTLATLDNKLSLVKIKAETTLADIDTLSKSTNDALTAKSNSANAALDSKAAQANSDITAKVTNANAAIDSKVATIDTRADAEIGNLQDAINTAAAAGAGAKGWDDMLVAAGENTTQRQVNDGFDSVSQLANIRNPRTGQRVYIKSYHVGLGKGGGTFVYDSAKSTINDGISVFNGWVRYDIPDAISPFLGGAKGDYTTDDYDAIGKALTLSRSLKKSVVIDGLFAVSKPIVLLSHDTMVGLTQLQSRIKKIGNGVLDLASRKAPERTDVTDEYNVDALVIFYPYDDDYANHITFKNVFLEKGSYNDGIPAKYGLYAPRHSACVTKNIRVENVEHGFFAKVLFLNQHANFTSVSGSVNGVHQGKIGMFVYDGEDKMTGTSNSFERFLFVNYEQAYQVQNLQTSCFSHCYGEAISKNDGADDTQVFFIVNPYNLHFNCCGMEGTKAAPLYIAASDTGNPNRSVTFTGFQARWGVSGTTVDRGVNAATVAGNDLRVTFDNSTITMSGGVTTNSLRISGSATVVKSASVIGDKVDLATGNARLIDLDKNVLTAQNTNILTGNSDKITGDLNAGIGWAAGVMHKVVDGATISVPDGIDAAYGMSVWYGLNPTQGVQMLYLVNNPNVYKRIVTATENIGAWTLA